MGLETEYAIRYSGPGPSPGNDRIYDALVRAISHRIAARPGDGAVAKNQVFLENGGAFYYEHLPYYPTGGLVEGATPECRSPSQLLLYQKAQEAQLIDALPAAELLLRSEGFFGELGLLKNCRDAEGHIYGAQENYEVTLAAGPTLWLYRAGLALLLPLILFQAGVSLLIQLGLAVVLILFTLAGLGALLVLPRARLFQPLAALAEADERTLGRLFGRSQLGLAYIVTWPITAPFALLLRWTAFLAIRRQALAFLISRPVLSGAGTVDDEGRFALSEKGPAIRRIMRVSISPHDRPVFDTGNLMKQAALPLSFRIAPLLNLFNRRQRLQLGLSDSNCAQVAEYLKVATTQLVLEMVENGFLADAPRLRKPISALRCIVADPSLTATVETRRGAMSGLEIQRFYLEKARAYLRASKTASLEAKRTVDLWQEVLVALESGERDSLVGRLDWVTKRFFLEACGKDAEPEAQREALLKTLDLRYHELGSGYFARLQAQGLAPVLVDPEEVRRAMVEPPPDTPARFRGALIRNREGSAIPVRVSWDSAWIGGRFQGRVIHFRTPQDGPETSEN